MKNKSEQLNKVFNRKTGVFDDLAQRSRFNVPSMIGNADGMGMAFLIHNGVTSGVMVNTKTRPSQGSHNFTRPADWEFWQVSDFERESLAVFLARYFKRMLVGNKEITAQGVQNIFFCLAKSFAFGNASWQSRNKGGITAFFLRLKNRRQLHGIKSISGITPPNNEGGD